MNAGISEYMMRSNDEFNERIDKVEDLVHEMMDMLVTIKYTVTTMNERLDTVSDSISFNPAIARGTSYEKYIKTG